jgi:hypothetical protein
MALDAIRARRSYQAWVANETIEDYSLRYAASSFRKWSPFVIANSIDKTKTKISGGSFYTTTQKGMTCHRISRKIYIPVTCMNRQPFVVRTHAKSVEWLSEIMLFPAYHKGKWNIKPIKAKGRRSRDRPRKWISGSSLARGRIGKCLGI